MCLFDKLFNWCRTRTNKRSIMLVESQVLNRRKLGTNKRKKEYLYDKRNITNWRNDTLFGYNYD